MSSNHFKRCVLSSSGSNAILPGSLPYARQDAKAVANDPQVMPFFCWWTTTRWIYILSFLQKENDTVCLVRSSRIATLLRLIQIIMLVTCFIHSWCLLHKHNGKNLNEEFGYMVPLSVLRWNGIFPKWWCDTALQIEEIVFWRYFVQDWLTHLWTFYLQMLLQFFIWQKKLLAILVTFFSFFNNFSYVTLIVIIVFSL